MTPIRSRRVPTGLSTVPKPVARPKTPLFTPVPASTDAALGFGLPRAKGGSHEFAGIGGGSRAVSAVMLGLTGAGVLVGAPVVARAEDLAPEDYEAISAAAAALESGMATMSADEVIEARRNLWSAYIKAGGIDSTTSTELAPVALGTELHIKTRGEVVFEDLAKRIEERMRVTAYDMAHIESVELVDGHPQYKKLSESEVRSMIVDALKDVPIGELPGGGSLARIVEALPNAGHLDAETMSFHEINDALGDAQKVWFKDKFGPFLEAHKVESIVVAAGTITALRYASPDAAGVLDKITPRIKLWRDSGEGWSARADLRYRDRRVLPDLDLTGRVTHDIGRLRLRADGSTTIAVERDEPISGRAGVGASLTEGGTWGDLYGSIDHRGRSSLGLTVGHRDADDGLSITGRASGTFGDGVAHGDASGRLGFTLDATKDIKFRGADGSVGLWAGYGVDTDGGHDDARVGVVFTLRW